MFARARVLARPLRLARRGLAAPKSKKSKQASQAADNDHKDAAYDFYKAIIDAPKRKRPKLPDDVAAAHFAIGREYNVKSRAKHDAFEARYGWRSHPLSSGGSQR